MAVVYGAEHAPSGRMAAVKVLLPMWSSQPSVVQRFFQEARAASAIDHPAIVEVFDFGTRAEVGAYIIMELLAGESLGQRIERLGRMPVSAAVIIGQQIADALGTVHTHGIIHRDLTPGNVHLIPDASLSGGERAKILDFGIAKLLDDRGRSTGQTVDGAILGTPTYMAPEQCRSASNVDHRADIYSLGCLLFHMVAGRPPFTGEGVGEVLAAHLHKPPPRLRELVPSVPPELDKLVGALLAKLPRERPGSMREASAALARLPTSALEEVLELEGAAPRRRASVGGADVTARDGDRSPPTRLYGREDELDSLRRAYQSVARGSGSVLTLILGVAGVGKTSLIRAFRRWVSERSCHFARGKFQQYDRPRPYEGVVEALRELAAEAALADEREAWRERVLDALGASACLLTEQLPELARLLGPQRPLPPLEPEERQRRFYSAALRFVELFAEPGRPLVFVLEDLQWADAASLALLERLFARGDSHDLLVLCSWRSDEVGASHPWMNCLVTLRESDSLRVEELSPTTLAGDEVARMLADTLSCTVDDVRELARLVHANTGGNPFFVTQFIASLRLEGLLRLDAATQRWSWDARAIAARRFGGDVIALLLPRIRALSASHQRALAVASCLGLRFTGATLARALGRADAEDELAASLEEPALHGLIAREGAGYRFVHDRAQQAAHAAFDREALPELRLSIARALLDETPAPDAARLFEIVGHYNQARARVRDADERERLARLNLDAGRRAKASVAYASAVRYFFAGVECLPEDAWERLPALAWALQHELAECCYLAGDDAGATRRFELLRARADSFGRAAAVAILEVKFHTARARNADAFAVGIRCLDRAGIKLPEAPSATAAGLAQDEVWEALAGREIESLLELLPVEQEDDATLMELFAALMAPAFHLGRELMATLACVMVRETIQRGQTPFAPGGYTAIGMILGPMFGRYEDGYRFGKLAHDLVERDGLTAMRARTHFVFGAMISPWTRPYAESVPYLRAAHEAAAESGDLLYQGYCAAFFVLNKLELGAPLIEVCSEAETRIAEAYCGKTEFIAHMIRAIERLARALCGTTNADDSFSSPGFDEEDFEAALASQGQATASCWYYVRKLQLLYTIGEHAAAAEAAREAQEVVLSSLAMFPDFLFYSALTMAALYSSFEDDGARGEAIAMIRMARDRFEVWSEHCAENFLARYQLVVAELARVEGRSEDALACYEQAQRVARTSEQVHIAAIGNECCARHFRARHMGGVGDAFVMKASRQYKQWGASAKVARLDPRAKAKASAKAEAETRSRPKPEPRPVTTPPSGPAPVSHALLRAGGPQDTIASVEAPTGVGLQGSTEHGASEVTQPGAVSFQSELSTLRRLQDCVDSPASWRLGELVAALGGMLTSDRGRVLLRQLDELALAQDRLRADLRRNLSKIVERVRRLEPDTSQNLVDDTMFQAQSEFAQLHTIADARLEDLS